MKKKSIVTQYMDISVISGKPTQCTHELIFGSALRKMAIADGLVIPLTHEEHNMAVRTVDRIHDNPRAEDLSKMAGQLAWEKEYYRRQVEPEGVDQARWDFKLRYGMSYL